MSRTSARQAIAIALMAGATMFASVIPAAAAATSAARPGVGTAVTPRHIREETCTSARKNWVHITFVNIVANVQDITQCFGGSGTWSFPGNVPISACSGNNHGSIAYYDASGNVEHWNFHAGQSHSFSNGDDLINVTINGWSGNDSC